LKEPTQCTLWKNPELAFGPLRERYELLETLVYESHWWRYLLKCRECGQRYFFEFYEEIDWAQGNDPQYSTLLPVETDEEIETLKRTSPFELLKYHPRLQHDFPRDAKTTS